jgi:hypothetical protein
MEWRDIAGVIGKAAPLVGTLIAGPAGATVGGLIASTLGVEAEPQAVAKALNTDPQALVKVRELELTHARDMQTLALQSEAQRLADVQHARTRDIELRKLTGGTNIRADILAFVAIGGLVALTYTLLFVALPEGPGRDVLLLLAGGLLAVAKEVYSYEFGSSRGSAMKSQQLEQRMRADG